LESTSAASVPTVAKAFFVEGEAEMIFDRDHHVDHRHRVEFGHGSGKPGVDPERRDPLVEAQHPAQEFTEFVYR
jgi:hypothetical protein